MLPTRTASSVPAKDEQAQEKLDKRAGELKEMEAELQKRAMVLSNEEKKRAAEDFDKRLV